MENLEEADTIIIMHAAHASADGYRAFVVRCDPSHIGDCQCVLHILGALITSSPVHLNCQKTVITETHLNDSETGGGIGDSS